MLDLIDRLQAGPFRKEDGTQVIDDQGRRVAASMESEDGLATAKSARAILEARRDAVDDSRAGRPTRYFLADPLKDEEQPK